jgi:hypothetical protein
MTFVPRAQKPRMSKSPRSSSLDLERDKCSTGGLGFGAWGFSSLLSSASGMDYRFDAYC